MVQDNSLLEQSRHSEQLSLQQLQLAELQKIANKLSNTSVGSGDLPQSVGGQVSNSSVGTNMPTNMMAVPANQNNPNTFANLAAVSGLALKSGVNTINNTATVGRSALDRSIRYIDNMQNSPFFAYKSIDWTRTNMEQAEYIQMQSRQKFDNAALKIGTSIGSMGMASLGGAIGSAAGPIGTVAGTVIGTAVGGIGGDQIMKHVGVQQGYEGWLQQNSNRFINMFESNDPYGNGFNSKEEKQLSKTLSKMNTEFYMNDDEIFTMLNQVTDAGLMKSSSDLNDFEKKFKGLVESVKSGAKMLNTSYEEMVSLYGEWNKMGIKTDAERAELTSQIKTLSSVTGASEGASANNLNELISGLVSGTTLDSADASNVAQSTLSLTSLFREKIGKTDGKYKDALDIIENDYKSNDKDVAASYMSMTKRAYGTENIKAAMGAALVQNGDGTVTVDQSKFEDIMSRLQNKEISMQDVMSEGGQNIIKNFDRAFQENFSTMDGNQAMQIMIEGVGESGTSEFVNQLLLTQSQRDGRNMEEMMMGMGITQNRNDAILWKSLADAQGKYGEAITSDVKSQNAANIIRNDASSEFGVSLTQRIKSFGEGVWQNVASGVTELIPSTQGIGDGIRDFWTDTDSALRNGYSSASKTNIADGKYKDVFADIKKDSQKLKEEFDIDLKSELERSSDVGNATKGFDTFLDVLTSPSRWNTALSGIFKGESVEYANTGLNHDGTSVKKLLKKVNKSSSMSDEEKQKMIDNINQSTGQTQDMVSSSLDVVTALGGRDAREKMLDSITIDTATKFRTGANSFDDFTNEKVLNKLSLDDQQRIQDLAVEQAVKQVNSKFGGNLDDLASLVQQKGYADGNEKVQSILEGGISKGEVKSLVKEMMTVTQGGTGEGEFNKLLGTVSEDAAKNTDKMNKSMAKANENMEDMSNKLDDFTDSVSKAIKTLFNSTNEIERRINKF